MGNFLSIFDTPAENQKKSKGFAAMPPEKRKEAASKGGRMSRGGGRTPKNKNLDVSHTPTPENKPNSKRGFAGMNPEKRKIIAAMGGKVSKGGGRPARNKATQKRSGR